MLVQITYADIFCPLNPALIWHQFVSYNIEEAGNLAAFYSKGRTAPKVEIDYLQKKNVKKPAGAKPGFVVYYTNYSLMASPDIAGIQQLS